MHLLLRSSALLVLVAFASLASLGPVEVSGAPAPDDESGSSWIPDSIKKAVGDAVDKVKESDAYSNVKHGVASVGETLSEIGHKTGEKLTDAKETFADFGHDAGDKLSSFGQSAGDKLSSFGQSAKESITNFGQSAGDKLRDVKDTVKDKLDDD